MDITVLDQGIWPDEERPVRSLRAHPPQRQTRHRPLSPSSFGLAPVRVARPPGRRGARDPTLTPHRRPRPRGRSRHADRGPGEHPRHRDPLRCPVAVGFSLIGTKPDENRSHDWGWTGRPRSVPPPNRPARTPPRHHLRQHRALLQIVLSGHGRAESAPAGEAGPWPNPVRLTTDTALEVGRY